MIGHTSTRRPAGVGLLLLFATAACGTPQRRPDAGAGPPLPGKLDVTSEPSGAAVFLDGTQRLGHTPLLVERPGETRLTLLLVKEGHVARTVSALVEGGKRRLLHVALDRSKGTLVVTTGVLRGARIVVDGERRGMTPQELELDADADHVLEVEKDGFEPHREVVRLKNGEHREVAFPLRAVGRKTYPTGFLGVMTKQPTLVFVDGRLLGMAPFAKVVLRVGSHRLEVRSGSAPGARSRSQMVTIKAGEVTAITVQLD